MEALSSLVKVTLPNYLSNLPIPDSFTGWFKLGRMYYQINFDLEKSIIHRIHCKFCVGKISQLKLRTLNLPFTIFFSSLIRALIKWSKLKDFVKRTLVKDIYHVYDINNNTLRM